MRGPRPGHPERRVKEHLSARSGAATYRLSQRLPVHPPRASSDRSLFTSSMWLVVGSKLLEAISAGKDAQSSSVPPPLPPSELFQSPLSREDSTAQSCPGFDTGNAEFLRSPFLAPPQHKSPFHRATVALQNPAAISTGGYQCLVVAPSFTQLYFTFLF